MMRIFLLAVFLVFAAAPAQSAETAPASTPLQEFQLLSAEKAKLTEKLREVTAFEKFYAAKKEKLAPEAKRLRQEQEDIMLQKPKVEAKCQGASKKGRRAAAAADAKCDGYRLPFEERVAKYTASQKLLKDEIDAIDQDEKTRAALQEKTTQNLAEATALLAELEKLVPASKQKECLLVCNAQALDAPVGAVQCVEACGAAGQ